MTNDDIERWLNGTCGNRFGGVLRADGGGDKDAVFKFPSRVHEKSAL